jgi:hypothetical protein
MDVTQTPGGARAGSTFQRPITVQLKNANGTNYTGANQQVTLSASTSTVLRQTVNGVTLNVTSVTVSSSGGVATFSDIGFQAGVTGAQTLTVTADAFVGTSLSVTPTFVATSITVTNSGTTAGQFIDGVFQANGATLTNIRADYLVSEMTARSLVVESSGGITISNAVASTNSSSSLSLTSTGGNVTVNAAISGISGMTVRCNSGSFTSSSAGTITTNDDVLIECGTVQTTGAISSGSDIRIESTNNASSANAQISGDVVSRATN